jgi:hypothetical protein
MSSYNKLFNINIMEVYMNRRFFFVFFFICISLYSLTVYAQGNLSASYVEDIRRAIISGNGPELKEILLKEPMLMERSFPENNKPASVGGTHPDDEYALRWFTILDMIAKYNQPALYQYLQSMQMGPEGGRFVHLLASGMTYDEDMNTPMHIAAQFGSLEFIQFTNYGFFDAKNKFGETPLFLLAKNKEIDARGIATAKYLLSIGADPEAENYEKVRLLRVVQNEELKKIIQEKISKK